MSFFTRRQSHELGQRNQPTQAISTLDLFVRSAQLGRWCGRPHSASGVERFKRIGRRERKMKRKCSAIYKIIIVFSLMAFSGCGSDSISLLFPKTAAPSVSTDAAYNVTTNSAVLNGHVISNWKDTDAWFEWSTSATMSSYSQTPSQFIGPGNNTIAISFSLSGLTSGTTYYYRSVAGNILGTSKGEIMSFTTL